MILGASALNHASSNLFFLFPHPPSGLSEPSSNKTNIVYAACDNFMLACSWSRGKDSALALYELMRSKEHEVVALLTTITEEYDRVTMHGVRNELLRQQALSIGLPIDEIRISENITEKE